MFIVAKILKNFKASMEVNESGEKQNRKAYVFSQNVKIFKICGFAEPFKFLPRILSAFKVCLPLIPLPLGKQQQVSPVFQRTVVSTTAVTSPKITSPTSPVFKKPRMEYEPGIKITFFLL